MLFSKVALFAVCLKISWAADDCAVHPQEDGSMGQHAMLQHSAKSSKGDVIQQEAAAPDILADGAETPKGDVFTMLDDKVSVLRPESLKLSSNAEAQAVSTSAYQSNGVLSENCDWQCYIDRYADLQQLVGTQNLVGAENHYLSFGKMEGRDCTCAESEASTASEEASSFSSSSSSWSASEPTSSDVSPTQDAEAATPSSEDMSYTYSPVSDMPVSDDAVSATDSQPTSYAVPPASDTSSEISSSSSSSLSATPIEFAGEATNYSEVATLSDPLAGAEETSNGSELVSSSSSSSSSSACDWQCYLNRYPDLQSVLGSDIAAAEEHFNSQGFSEGRVCTCDGIESPMVADESAKDAELANLRVQVETLQAQAQNQGSAALTDRLSTCQPYAEGEKEALDAKINEYVHSDGDKFQQKVLEAKGEAHASAGHVAIMKYLRDKVLKEGMSILDVGCSAGSMLRFIKDEYDNGLGQHDSLVGVEQAAEWVQFAQEHFTGKGIEIYPGDITEFAFPEPYDTKTFDLVMLNDVLGYVQTTRYGCFFSQLDRMTHPGSVVYVHSPSPTALLSETEPSETVVPHHLIVSGMAAKGFELVAFEHDKDTICGGEENGIPRQLKGAGCYQNGWPKYVHTTFRKVDNQEALNIK